MFIQIKFKSPYKKIMRNPNFPRSVPPKQDIFSKKSYLPSIRASVGNIKPTEPGGDTGNGELAPAPERPLANRLSHCCSESERRIIEKWCFRKKFDRLKYLLLIFDHFLSLRVNFIGKPNYGELSLEIYHLRIFLGTYLDDGKKNKSYATKHPYIKSFHVANSR